MTTRRRTSRQNSSARRWSVYVTALVLVAGASACGGDDSDSSSAPSTAAATATDVDSDTAAPDSDASTLTDGRFPVGFPMGIVRFPLGFVLDGVEEQDAAGSTTWVVTGSVDEPRSPVREELVVVYGEPETETGDASYPNDAPVVLTWTDIEGFAATYALTNGDNGGTAINAVVKEVSS